MLRIIRYGVALLSLLHVAGCRGYSTQDPPIHLNPNMDTQRKGKAYRASDFFEDGKYMRYPIKGTVARGQLREDEHLYAGKVLGKFATFFPKDLSLDEAFLARGQIVFNRVCAVCHSHIGDGDGLVGRRLMVRPTSFHSDYMYGLPPGHYFDVILNGIRTMPSYGHLFGKIDARTARDASGVMDAWAVVAYIRSLQMSQDMDGEWIDRSASWWKQR